MGSMSMMCRRCKIMGNGIPDSKISGDRGLDRTGWQGLRGNQCMQARRHEERQHQRRNQHSEQTTTHTPEDGNACATSQPASKQI